MEKEGRGGRTAHAQNSRDSRHKDGDEAQAHGKAVSPPPSLSPPLSHSHTCGYMPEVIFENFSCRELSVSVIRNFSMSIFLDRFRSFTHSHFFHLFPFFTHLTFPY